MEAEELTLATIVGLHNTTACYRYQFNRNGVNNRIACHNVELCLGRFAKLVSKWIWRANVTHSNKINLSIVELNSITQQLR